MADLPPIAEKRVRAPNKPREGLSELQEQIRVIANKHHAAPEKGRYIGVGTVDADNREDRAKLPLGNRVIALIDDDNLLAVGQGFCA